MDKLWAPWRIRYITKNDKKEKGCLFCNIIKEKKDKQNLIFIRTKESFAVLNLYPYNNGHCMIVPNKHVSDLKKLSRDQKLDLYDLLEDVKELLEKKLKPEGFNIGLNIGRVAGAGIPGHIHIHIVPRWNGDNNFMPTVAGTKVISQSLEQLYEILNNAY